MRSQRRPFFAHVPDASRFQCPVCNGYAIGCTHCSGNGFVYCGPSLHDLDGAVEWPEADGVLSTCRRCRTSVLKVAHGAREDSGHMNEVA